MNTGALQLEGAAWTFLTGQAVGTLPASVRLIYPAQTASIRR